MGYDDNVPLTGVTGGGLPAEIWQVFMSRIHEGLTPRPLNRIVPEPQVSLAPSDREVPVGGGDTVVDRVFRDVVRGMNGGETPPGAGKMPGDDL